MVNQKFYTGIGLAIVLVGAIFWMTSSSDADKQSANTVASALTISTVIPQQESWPQTVMANGNVTAWQEAVISAEIGGLRINELLVEVGAYVKRGDVLAVLAPETVKADLAENEANLAVAKANLIEATANANRSRNLKDSGALSKQQIDQYLALEQAAIASVEAAEARLKSTRIKMSQTKIVAVDDGVISERKATLGSVVQSGAELFKLVRGNRLEWRAEVVAQHLSQIKSGQAADIRLPNGESVKGTVRIVSPTLDQGSRTALVYVDLPNDSPARAGMYARGNITVSEAMALTVPQSALVIRDGKNYVFAYDKASEKAVQLIVTTGRRQSDRVEIVSGLKPETKVISSGAAFLNDGDHVRLATDAAMKTAANGS
jgi:HlyD family secretion protein